MGKRREHLLVAAGYETVTVRAADEALPLLMSRSFDILIAGQMVSHMDKVRVIQQAHQEGIPVIVIHALPEDETSAADFYVRISDGADGLLCAIRQVERTLSCPGVPCSAPC